MLSFVGGYKGQRRCWAHISAHIMMEEHPAFTCKLGILMEVLEDNCVQIILSNPNPSHIHTQVFILFFVFKMAVLTDLSEHRGLLFFLHSVEFSRIKNQIHPFPLLQLKTNVPF